MSKPTPPVYVRLAKPEEFDEIADVGHRAFIHDPVFNYFGGYKELIQIDTSTESQTLRSWIKFLLVSCHSIGGQITVAVKTIDEAENGVLTEQIVCAAFWCPPNKRLTLWRVMTLVQGGLIGVLRGWGLAALNRIGFEYHGQSQAALVTGYDSKGIKESPDASWYLILVMTEPAFSNQGFMSLIMRDLFNRVLSDAPIALEATTAESRDRYQHLGFEVLNTINVGKGKVDSMGLFASGEDAVGVDAWLMANLNPEQTKDSTQA